MSINSQSIVGVARRYRAALSKWQRPLLVLAIAVFVVGIAWSLSRLDLTWSKVSLVALALDLFVGAPLLIALNALGLCISARILAVSISYRTAIAAVSVGALVNVLPVPGGAVARAVVLMQAGASTRASAGVILFQAFLWVGLAFMFASAALLRVQTLTGVGCAAFGMAGIAVSLGWLIWRAGLRLALAALAMRLVALTLLVGRVLLAFMAIGAPISPADAALFALANILVAAAAIAPGAIGMSQALSAGLALLVAIPPEEAFVAMALNQVVSLVMSGGVFLAISAIMIGRVSEPRSTDVNLKRRG